MILLKSQDIVVLLKLCLERGSPTLATLGAQLGISASEIHGSMKRTAAATLLDLEKRKPRLLNLLEFLEHGIRYVFISRRGEITRGIPTAHSAPPLADLLMHAPSYRPALLTEAQPRSNAGGSAEVPQGPLAKIYANERVDNPAMKEVYDPGPPGPLARMFGSREPPLVWPHPEGEVRGESLEPLYPSAVDAARRDGKLYEVLALVDALRVGRAREKALAIDLLDKRLRAS